MGVQLTGWDDLIKYLDKLSTKPYLDSITQKAVNQAKEVGASSMRSAIASSEFGERSTGSVAASVVTTYAKVNSYGTYSVAMPSGHDKKGKRNGEKAAYLEYGSPTLAARPWRARAVTAAKGHALKIMEEILKSEMKLE